MDRGDEQRGHEKPRAQQHPGIGTQDVHDDRGRYQEAHQMVGRRQREQVHDQNELVVAPRGRGLVGPSHGQPQHQRDRQHTQRVDLLVHDRLIPHGEGRASHERPRGRRDAPPPPGSHHGLQPPLRDQEPDAGSHRAGRRRQQIDPPGVVAGEREQAPDVRQDDEERIAGRMGDSEGVGGRDVLRGVPELRGRRKGDEVQDQGAHGHAARPQIGSVSRAGGGRRSPKVGHAAVTGQCLNCRMPVNTIATPA